MQTNKNRTKAAYNKGFRLGMKTASYKTNSSFNINFSAKPKGLSIKWGGAKEKSKFEAWVKDSYPEYEDDILKAVSDPDVISDFFAASSLQTSFRIFSENGFTDAEVWECYENSRVYTDFEFYQVESWLSKLYNDNEVNLAFVGMYVDFEAHNVDTDSQDDIIISEKLYDEWRADKIVLTDEVLYANEI